MGGGGGENENVHELGREVGRDGTGNESLDLGLDGSLTNLTEVRRTQVGSEENDGVFEVDDSLRRGKGRSQSQVEGKKKSGTTHSLAVSQSAFVEDLEEEGHELPACLLNLVNQNLRRPKEQSGSAVKRIRGGRG